MFTMVGIAGETSFTVGSRWPVEDEGLAGMILATGRPARKQDYTTMPGPLGAAVRDGGMISAVGVPIVVEGSIWGFMTAGARQGKPIPDGTEERLARFTELVATAIADSQARDRLAQLAYEQSALRRVATMVARAPASEQLFSTVAREVASVLDVPGVIVTRYEPDGTAVTVGEAFGPDLAGAEQFLGIGTPMPPDPGTLTALVFDTHDPARVDDLSTSPGTVGEVARAAELGSGCAGPIVVNGAVWGKMCVFSRVGAVLPAGTENRLQRLHRPRCHGDRELRGARRTGSVGGARSRASRRAGGAAAGGHARGQGSKERSGVLGRGAGGCARIRRAARDGVPLRTRHHPDPELV